MENRKSIGFMNDDIKQDTNKKVFVFDLHDVLFARNYWVTIIQIFKIKNKKNLLLIVCNPRFIYDALKMLSITRVSEAYVIKLSQKYSALAPYVDTIIDITNALRPTREMFTLVENLKLKGYKIYIFSNIGYITFKKLTQPYKNLFDYFDGIHHVHAENGWLAKPHQEAYRLFLKKFNIDPLTMIFIDDKPKNVIAAQTLGITAIQYKSTRQLHEQLSQLMIIN